LNLLPLFNREQFDFQLGEISSSDLETAFGIIWQLREILGVVREESGKLAIFHC
jgi:hypothetical protein